MAYAIVPRFHNYYDAAVRSYLGYKRGVGWTTTTVRRHFTIEERQLSYSFAPHFHPYVAELVKRLIEGSVPGLQAADTDYVPNPDGTLVTLPGSVRATLADGTPVSLADDTWITVP